MRIALVYPTFSENMGYLGNTLPKYLAREGVEVHVIAADLPHNYYLPSFRDVYAAARDLGALPAGTTRELDGYTLHIMSHVWMLGYVRIPGLLQMLGQLRPDAVQVLSPIGPISLEAALGSIVYGYKLFTGCHNSASTFPLARRAVSAFAPERIACLLKRGIHGRMISLRTEKCYAVTCDCADIAVQFFGVQADKVEVMHLCVEVEMFHPVLSDSDRAERATVRTTLGIAPDEIVCLYTGKLTEEKNALILAEAVAQLRAAGQPYRALIIGSGPQRDRIAACDGAVVVPFIPYPELPPYYRVADIGVWPTNESTSMLDAAASGLPLIVSDGIVYRDHVDGNGIVVRMNDRDDLVRALCELGRPEERARLGRAGVDKMRRDFSCEGVARRRLADYKTAVMGECQQFRSSGVQPVAAREGR